MSVLIIVFDGHEVLVGVVAGGTFYGRLGAFCDVAAYQALPLDGFVAFPYGAVLDAFCHCEEAVAVVKLDSGDGAEAVGNLSEALFVGYFCRLGVGLNALYARVVPMMPASMEVGVLTTAPSVRYFRKILP